METKAPTEKEKGDGQQSALHVNIGGKLVPRKGESANTQDLALTMENLELCLSQIETQRRSIRTLKERCDKTAGENIKLREQTIAWRIVAQEMTPGGSEFMTPEAIRAYYRTFKDDAHQAKKDQAKLREQVRELLAVLKGIDSELQGTLPVTALVKEIARAAIKHAEEQPQKITRADIQTTGEKIPFFRRRTQ